MRTIEVDQAVKTIMKHSENLTPEQKAVALMIATLLNDENEIPTVEPIRPSYGMFECFHCGSRSVIWDSDFVFSDYGLDGDGIINECHCENCGADIMYFISTDSDEDEVAE